MPTINQLVRKGRKKTAKKAKTVALRYTFNALKNRMVEGKGGQAWAMDEVSRRSRAGHLSRRDAVSRPSWIRVAAS